MGEGEGGGASRQQQLTWNDFISHKSTVQHVQECVGGVLQELYERCAQDRCVCEV